MLHGLLVDNGCLLGIRCCTTSDTRRTPRSCHGKFSALSSYGNRTSIEETERKDSPMANVKPIPEGMHTITPHIVVNGAAKAIDFYKRAFGAEEKGRHVTPDGRIMHAAI